MKRGPTATQWVTFLVLLCFVVGSVVIGGLSFRSGPREATPSPDTPKEATASPEALAVARWKEAVGLNPKDPFTLRNLARAELAGGNLKEARRAAETALKFSGPDLLGVELLGRIALKEGKADEAVLRFRQAVRLSPQDPLVVFELASALTLSGKDHEAAGAYEKIISLSPNSMEAVRSREALLGLAMYEKRYPDAEKQALALLRMAPDDSGLHVKLGEIYEAEKKIPAAILSYEKARSAAFDDPLLLSHLAELYASGGQEEAAAQLWMEMIKKNPQDPKLKLDLARLDKKMGKKGEARDLLERAEKEAQAQKNEALEADIKKALNGL